MPWAIPMGILWLWEVGGFIWLMVEKLALLPRKLEDPQKPEQVPESLHKHPCRWLSTIFMPLPVLIPCRSQALWPDLCSASRGWPLKWEIPEVEMACGTGQPGAVTCSSWELCWLLAHAEHDVNPACSSPTQPLETASTRSQAPRWFCFKKIREHYQQRPDRQSSSAEWKINWSSKTATCCSCLLSECTASEHFPAACHDKQSGEDSMEPSPAAAPGLKESFHLLFLVWQEAAHLSLSWGNHYGHSSATTKMGVKAAIWN